ncbi:MAG: CehA/McbA family metallohydrolase [Candidatus Hinthialibacter antarcticus]|nr:CehA/McbA family metallohydrolase [Candidatus Hinthialibacter antarcticus]
MSDWTPLFKHTFSPQSEAPPPSAGVWFAVMHGIQSLRINCSIDAPPPLVEIILFGPNNEFRGRWDAAFQGWKVLDQQGADDGFITGDIQSGQWRIELRHDDAALSELRASVLVEGSTSAVHKMPELLIYQPEDEEPDEDAPSSWMIGELYETTTRSNGAMSVNQTLSAYQNKDCGFVVLADRNQPPLEKYAIDPGLSVIRGQSLQTPQGNALLLGVRERIDWKDAEGEKPLASLIRETHIADGLFCLAEPFAREHTPWLEDEEASALIDLLQIWPGQWEKRFAEIQKAMTCWDALLNQGFRIYGMAGKGPQGRADDEDAVRIPKTVAFTQGPSETALLSALKQGRFYSTVEPALSLWTESAHGGAMIGDEMRLPIGTPYLLYLSISQLEKGGYFTVRTNEGIYCQTPYSTRKDTTFKLVGSAHSGWQWFRLEVYQFARPFDRLIAFSNPIFIRGIVSA